MTSLRNHILGQLHGRGTALFQFQRYLPNDEIPQIKVVPIARGHGGKTAAMMSVPCMLGEQLPSGLSLGAKNPLAMAKAVQEHKQANARLQHEGYRQTLESRTVEFPLKSSGEIQCELQLRDIVGQILSHTTEDSAEPQLHRYHEYVRQAALSDVLWVIQSPPHVDTRENLARFRDDLLITQSYLEEALRQRENPQQCTVVFVIGKVDSLFETPQQAIQQLDPERMLLMFEPLTAVVQASRVVASSAIFPLSSFGFGNAMLDPRSEQDSKERADRAEKNTARSREEEEAEWILKPGRVFEPFNLIPLLVYTIKEGIGNYHPPLFSSRKKKLEQVLKQLRSDFPRLRPWYVPVKGS